MYLPLSLLLLVALRMSIGICYGKNMHIQGLEGIKNIFCSLGENGPRGQNGVRTFDKYSIMANKNAVLL